MSAPRHVLAIDQGTTSTRAMVFDADGAPVAAAQRELPQSFPQDGWVEHDPERIWQDVLATCREALASAGVAASGVAALGITNQRETVVLWERASGAPLHPAIVWQDRRTADACRRLRADGLADLVRERTGLLLDPYFSATKLAWMLDTLPGARVRARDGDLAAGTIDSFLLWRLTGGRVHATDATNASRTLLFDIHRQEWDDELLEALAVPRELLPGVRDCADDFGATDADLLGAPIPVTGIAGDQQAATVGQACWDEGAIKSTYGTGCFAVLNTGPDAVRSEHRLLTTVAYRLGRAPCYALEGSIFAAGSTIQWLRDGLGLLAHAKDSEAMAKRADDRSRVYLVPAFTGLGAPYWDAGARAALIGVTRDTTADEVARAALEAVAFQTRDLLEAMEKDAEDRPSALRVDGGLVANDWAMQRLADLTAMPVERPVVHETTALGAATLAGMHVGLYPGTEGLAARWKLERRFEPGMKGDEREERYAGWRAAVRRTLSA